MTVKKFEPIPSTREEWLAIDKQTLEDGLARLDEEYPLVLHTDAGRSFSTVRRMKAEKRMGIPIYLRTGFAISVKTGKAANAMNEDEWEEFYNAISERLNRDYPDLYKSLFSPNESGKPDWRDTPDDFRTGVNIDTFPASLQAQTRVAGRYRHLGQPSKARLFSVSSHRLNSLVSIAARQASMFRPMAAAASARPSSEKTKVSRASGPGRPRSRCLRRANTV